MSIYPASHTPEAAGQAAVLGSDKHGAVPPLGPAPHSVQTSATPTPSTTVSKQTIWDLGWGPNYHFGQIVAADFLNQYEKKFGFD